MRDVVGPPAACGRSRRNRNRNRRRSTTAGNTRPPSGASTGGSDDSGRSTSIAKEKVELGKRHLLGGKGANAPGGNSQLDNKGSHTISNQNVERNDVGLEI